MNTEYINALTDHGRNLITYINLVDNEGTEIPLPRKPVVWATPEDGTFFLDEDITFDVPAGFHVQGWRGYDAEEEGTELCGADVQAKLFAQAGSYTLVASGTGVYLEA